MMSVKESSNKSTASERRYLQCGQLGHFKRDCTSFSKPKSSKPRGNRQMFRSRYPKSSSADKKQAHFAAAFISDGYTDVDFVLDSAATNHFCSQRQLFKNFKNITSSAATAKGTTRILGVGDIAIEIISGTVTRNLVLTNVYFAPDMNRNLISIRCLCIEDFSVSFQKDKAVLYFNNSEFLNVSLKDRFYSISAICKIDIESPEMHIAYNDVMVWHARYGHLNCGSLIKFSKSENVVGLDKLNGEIKTCETCNFSKSKRESFHERDDIQTSQILDLLHLDIWGPAPVPSLGGARYFLTIIDDHSRYSFVYILSHKNQAFSYFKNFKVFIERQMGKKIKRIRTDCGGEFCAKYFEDYLRENGINHEKTNVYSPQMNGIAERYNRSLMEGVRSLLGQAGLPPNLWAELVCTHNYLKNRFPHKKLKGKAPLNVWRGKRFSARHLKIVGSTAYVHIPARHRNKLENRAKKGVLVGYASSTVGYRIWYPGTTNIEETKHVKIDEDCPYFKVKKESKSLVKFTLSESQENRQASSPLPVKDWERIEKIRQTGKTAGKVDVYYYPEEGVRLRSKNDVEKYCSEKNIPFNPGDYNFKSSFTDKSKATPLSENIEDDSEGNKSDIEAHCIAITPMTYQESQNLPEKQKWHKAMEKELKILEEREVFDLVPRPEKSRVLGSKWVFTIKKDETGKNKCFKARFVAKGFRQIEGIDYFDTFSPVVSFSLVRLFFVVLVIGKGWLHQHLDINSAYLYAKLNEQIYIEQPEGFIEKGKENFVMKLKKALYGLHQAGREWYFELDNAFLKLDFEKLKDSNCIYMYKNEVVILVYVDDLAIFSKNKSRLEEVIKLIESKFKIKNLGRIKNFLGVEFEQKEGEIHMHQKKYIEKITKVFEDIPKVKCKLPLTPGTILNVATDGEQATRVPYRQLIGCLLFLASRTRPDILFSVIALSQFSSNPSWSHWKYLCQIFQYVVGTSELCINLSRNANLNLTVYTDASWASDIVDRKSISGFAIFIDKVPIIWSSTKQKCTALSSMEAEYIALSDSIKELCWLLRIVNNFSFLHFKKPEVFCDNQSTISFSKNNIENSRTKYIDTRYYFVRDNLDKLELKYVSGKANVADVFTKALPGEKFSFYCKWLFG